MNQQEDKIALIVEVSIAKGTDLNVLTQRVTEQINKIANPQRDDQGILAVREVWWKFGSPFESER